MISEAASPLARVRRPRPAAAAVADERADDEGGVLPLAAAVDLACWSDVKRKRMSAAMSSAVAEMATSASHSDGRSRPSAHDKH